MTVESDSAPADLLARVDELCAAHRHGEAAALLAEALRVDADVTLASRFLRVQHEAFAGVDTTPGRAMWPPSAPDRFAGSTSLPEIDAVDLDADVLASALHHHGSLLLRGFLDADVCAELRDLIDRAFVAEQAWEADRDADHAPWFVPFVPGEGYSLGEWERLFVTYGGGVHAVDSPRVWFRMVDALAATGVVDPLAGYFGERPALSAKKSTLRRAEPGCRAGWHQDGAFLGADTRSVNIWTTLTDSGVDAPGLEVVHRQFDRILETGTEGAQFTWSVSPDVARAAGGDVIEHPVFRAGDALLFDEKTLHQTFVDPAMTKTRYAIETWFFAPSTYPHEQIPICF